MGHIEKTVFISYRRTNLPWALCIYQNLTMHGFDVFFDYQSIDSGNFEKVIIENIKARAHFLVVLTPTALDRLKEPNDWLRREIETAINEKRNIVPLMLESFDFGSPLAKHALTGKLETLSTFNGLKIYSEYFFEAMDKLRERYLKVEVGNITTLNNEVQGITETQQIAASEAPQVEKDELSAQEWHERGVVFAESGNYDEAIRCYDEAIRLKPEVLIVHLSRGVALRLKGDLNSAINAFSEIIRINPNYALAYNNRGEMYRLKNETDDAIADFTKAIQVDSEYYYGYYSRGRAFLDKGDKLNALKDLLKASTHDPEYGPVRSLLVKVLLSLGRIDEAKEQEKIGRELFQEDDEYDRACFEANCGNIDIALELLKVGLEKNQVTKKWAKNDPDFENIRDDPRFKELVGE